MFKQRSAAFESAVFDRHLVAMHTNLVAGVLELSCAFETINDELSDTGRVYFFVKAIQLDRSEGEAAPEFVFEGCRELFWEEEIEVGYFGLFFKNGYASAVFVFVVDCRCLESFFFFLGALFDSSFLFVCSSQSSLASFLSGLN